MPRCYECSKVVFSRYGYDSNLSRTWSSGPELIRSADSGCDLCSFIRKDLEKVSAANVRRINDQAPIVLRECNGPITISGRIFIDLKIPEFHYLDILYIKDVEWAEETWALDPPRDPILRACELLEACVLGGEDKHHLCKPCEVDAAVQATSLPRRLLDLSHGDIILTLDTQEWISGNRATIEELSRYCTLSYRWGQGPPACMLRTQLTKDRITVLVSMPQTFQDAIMVARGLGIRFLWIDALCIVQPSAHGDYTDWNAEGPRMWLVYENAICTISATCSNNPNEGFLEKVGTDYNPPCGMSAEGIVNEIEEHMLLHSNLPTIYNSVVASSLNRRGWVAQERLLSRRILHFTEEGVFWECQATDTTEDLSDDELAVEESAIGQNIGSHHASLMIFGDWLAFIELYSLSEFTLQTDRLTALSSIARCVATERFGHRYYAGIWESHLSRCLSWRSSAPCSARTREKCLTIAPSWSWASVPGGIEYRTRRFGAHSEALAEIIDVQAVLAEASNQYGNLTKASLRLRAPIFCLSLPTTGEFYAEFDDPCFSTFDATSAKLAWDEVQDPHIAVKVYTIVLVGIIDDYPESIVYDAIVVSRLLSTDGEDGGGSRGVYRRIGHLYYWLDVGGGGAPDDPDRHPELRLLYDRLFPDAALQTIVIE